jgi:hypothetical protein
VSVRNTENGKAKPLALQCALPPDIATILSGCRGFAKPLLQTEYHHRPTKGNSLLLITQDSIAKAETPSSVLERQS